MNHMPRGADFNDALAEFFSELMGHRSGYGLDRLGADDDPAEAAAVIRLRLRLAEQLLARGWQAPPGELEDMRRDRALLQEADDEWTAHWMGTANGTFAESSDAEVRQMRQAMESRAVIEQAKGVAMERYGLSAATAWSWLVRTSQQRNEKLRELAQHIVESVAEPGSGRSLEDSKR